MRKIVIYATESHVSVSIQNGATRETSGTSWRAVVDAMPPQDRETLAAFCGGVLTSLRAALPGGGGQ